MSVILLRLLLRGMRVHINSSTNLTGVIVMTRKNRYQSVNDELLGYDLDECKCRREAEANKKLNNLYKEMEKYGY